MIVDDHSSSRGSMSGIVTPPGTDGMPQIPAVALDYQPGSAHVQKRMRFSICPSLAESGEQRASSVLFGKCYCSTSPPGGNQVDGLPPDPSNDS